MKKIRKLVDIDSRTLKILEQEAKRQKRSLKSQLELTIEERAMRLEEPSEEYTTMMDSMLAKLDKGELKFDPIAEIRAKYEL